MITKAETLGELLTNNRTVKRTISYLESENSERTLSYGELYSLWERQQWAVQDIDFSQDRIDWHERIPAEERFQRMYGLSSFFIGEQRVAEGMLALTGQHFIIDSGGLRPPTPDASRSGHPPS